MPELEWKRVPFEVKEISDDGDGWQIAGYASTFGPPADAYGDVVAPGAFAESLAQRKTKFLYEHSEPIGKEIELREDPHGLWGRWSVVDTRAGTDAYKLARAGVLDSLSIGFVVDDAEHVDGVRVLKKVTLYEVSAVAIPANPSAVVTAVKAQPTAAMSRTEPATIVGLDIRRRRLARHGIQLGAPR